MQKDKNKNKDKNEDKPARQNGEIYDALDFRLALLDLNRRGFDLRVSAVAADANRLQVTCNKTQNHFAIEWLGHREWPVRSANAQSKRGGPDI